MGSHNKQMNLSAIQLELLPMRKLFQNKTYMLVAAEQDADMAKIRASILRGRGCAVRIEKDKEGKVDVAGSYLIWARLKQVLGGAA